MNPLSNAELERWEDLKAAELLFGLSLLEQAEFDQLSARVPAEDAGHLEQVVASLDVAWSDASLPPLPDHLRESVLAQAKRELPAVQEASASVTTLKTVQKSAPPTVAPVSASPAAGWRFRDYFPWLVSAACLALAAFLAFPREVARQPAPDLARQRAELISTAGDLVQAKWSPGTTPIAGATGDIVWSSQRQQGIMRFRGLPPNVPTKEQYQLWIFDKNQSDKTPIDGGVFDIADAGEAIVPIDAKLRVDQAFMFAVTIEKPGGVVVSTRERLPLLAKVE